MVQREFLIRNQASGIRHQESGIRNQASGIRNEESEGEHQSGTESANGKEPSSEQPNQQGRMRHVSIGHNRLIPDT
jgi:hypothetical protein